MMRGARGMWSPRAQFVRVLKSDTRAAGIDAILGLVYVTAGFYLNPHEDLRPLSYVAPMVLLCISVVYLFCRTCGEQTEKDTVVFYANLPRNRAITYWAHLAWLGGYALFGEVLIATGIWVGLHGAEWGTSLAASLAAFLLPFSLLAAGLWYAFARPNVWKALATAMATLLLPVVAMAWGEVQAVGPESSPFVLILPLLPALGAVLLTGHLVARGAVAWTTLQIGERT